MLIHDFAYVEAPAAEVVARLCAAPTSWLSGLSDASGEVHRIRIGPAEAVPFLSKAVVVECGTPGERGNVTIVPLTWRPDGMAQAFPALEAELEIVGLGPRLTEISLMGRYVPPFGAVGRRLDQAMLHRVARAGVRSFMRRLATALSEAEGEPHRSSGGSSALEAAAV